MYKTRFQFDTTHPVALRMLSGTNEVTGLGTNVTVALFKNLGASNTATGTVAERSNGIYSYSPSAADMGTLGEMSIRASGAGADPFRQEINIVAYDPYNFGSLGFGSNVAFVNNIDNGTSSGNALLAAVTNTASPGIVFVGPGTYDLGAQTVPTPDGVSIIGAGNKGVTIFKTSAVNNNTHPTIKIPSNACLKRFSTWAPLIDGTFTYPIGFGNSQTPANNFLVEDVDQIDGDSDFIYLSSNSFSPAQSHGTFRRLGGYARFDAVNLVTRSGAVVDWLYHWEDCKFHSKGNSQTSPTNTLGRGMNLSGGTHVISGCKFFAEYSITAQAISIAPSTANAMEVRINDSFFHAVTSNGAALDFNISATNLVSVYLSNVAYNPTNCVGLNVVYAQQPQINGANQIAAGAIANGAITTNTATVNLGTWNGTAAGALPNQGSVTAQLLTPLTQAGSTVVTSGTNTAQLATTSGAATIAGGASGVGNVQVTHNTPSTDIWRVTLNGTPINGVTVNAYLTTVYAAGLAGPASNQGQTVTAADGRWAAALSLSAPATGTLNYTLVFSKPGSYPAQTATITINSAGVVSTP